MPLGDGIHQSVHDGVEHQHRQRITLEDADLEVDGCCLPRLGGNHSYEILVQTGDHVYHLRGSMVLLDGEPDQVVVDTAKGIGQVKPAQGSMFPSCLAKHGQQLDVVLSAARHSINKGLLHGSVEVVVCPHVGHPTLLQQAGEYLANAGGQGNGAEVDLLGSSTACFFPNIQTR